MTEYVLWEELVTEHVLREKHLEHNVFIYLSCNQIESLRLLTQASV